LLNEAKWRKLDLMIVEMQRMLTALVQRVQPVVITKRTLGARTQRLEIASS
jgi:hypothetical protein